MSSGPVMPTVRKGGRGGDNNVTVIPLYLLSAMLSNTADEELCARRRCTQPAADAPLAGGGALLRSASLGCWCRLAAAQAGVSEGRGGGGGAGCRRRGRGWKEEEEEEVSHLWFSSSFARRGFPLLRTLQTELRRTRPKLQGCPGVSGGAL